MHGLCQRLLFACDVEFWVTLPLAASNMLTALCSYLTKSQKGRHFAYGERNIQDNNKKKSHDLNYL